MATVAMASRATRRCWLVFGTAFDRLVPQLAHRCQAVMASGQGITRVLGPDDDRLQLALLLDRLREFVDQIGTQLAHAIRRDCDVVQPDHLNFGFHRRTRFFLEAADRRSASIRRT
jgi:hypothetical protein